LPQHIHFGPLLPGRFFCGGQFLMMNILTNESLPTVYRSAGFGGIQDQGVKINE
jgi:hypothetical protein